MIIIIEIHQPQDKDRIENLLLLWSRLKITIPYCYLFYDAIIPFIRTCFSPRFILFHYLVKSKWRNKNSCNLRRWNDCHSFCYRLCGRIWIYPTYKVLWSSALCNCQFELLNYVRSHSHPSLVEIIFTTNGTPRSSSLW